MISVVIPTLHAPLLGQAIAALQQQTAAHLVAEILVVGQDRHGLVPAGVRFVETPQPVSAAAARNIGARLASGTYLLFVDADCIATPDMVARLYARHSQGCAVVGGGVALEPAPYWIQCDNVVVFAQTLSDTDAGARDYLPSLNFSIERKLFLSIGGFDEGFPGAAGEDTDLSLRLRQRGYTLWFEPRAAVYHRPARGSARGVWAHLRRFGQVHVRFWQSYPALTGGHRLRRLRRWWGVVLALSPLLALRDGIGFIGRMAAQWRWWYLLPGVVWGKIAWYWGVAEALVTTNDNRISNYPKPELPDH
jgi:GT2 family glycosyltransferase